MCTTHNMCTIINISLSLAGMQTAHFSAAAAVWVTCVNRVDPMSFFFFFGGGGGGGLGGSEGLIIISSTVILYCIYQISTINSGL